MTFLWAYVAGLLTLINPCVLPLLPIIIASALQASRYGPLALAIGLVFSFTVFGLAVTAFGHLIGLDEERLNQIAAVMMIIFGIVLLVPRLTNWLSSLATPLASRADNQINQVQSGGVSGQLAVGVLLGAVWSPCIGPTLGGAIGLAATGENLFQAFLTMLVFGLGVATILLGLAYGSREVLMSRRSRLEAWMPYAKPIMGIALLLVGLMILFHINRYIEIWLLEILPAWLVDFSVKY